MKVRCGEKHWGKSYTACLEIYNEGMTYFFFQRISNARLTHIPWKKYFYHKIFYISGKCSLPRSMKIFSPFKCKDNKHFLEIKLLIKIKAICQSIIFLYAAFINMVVETKHVMLNSFFTQRSIYSLFHVCSCIILYFFWIFIATSNVIFCVCGLHRNFKIFWTATIITYHIVTTELIIFR